MRKVDYIFFLFLLVVSFDPTNHYTQLKDVLFIILVLYGIWSFIKKKSPVIHINRLILLVFPVVPLWGYLVANILGNYDYPEYAEGQLRSMLFVLLFFFLISMKLDVLLKIFWLNGLLLSILTLIFFSLGQTNDVFWGILYENRDENYLIAMKRDFLGVEVSGFYFKSGPFIILAFVYNLYHYSGRFKMILSIIMYMALLFAGSRTPALIQTLVLLIYLYDSKAFGKKITVLVSLVAVLSLFYLTYSLATQKDESSNETKYENFSSYIDDLSVGGHAFWGAGLGSAFYAKGRGVKVAFSELSYMDVLRIYGLIVGGFLIFLYFSPYFFLKKFFKYSLFLRRYCLGYVLFLLLCGTNPLLLGSIGLTALSIMMAIVNKSRYFVIDKRNKTLMFESCRY